MEPEMNPAILVNVLPLLPLKAVATFEDPAVAATSQMVTVVSLDAERCEVVTKRGNRYSLNGQCLNLHAYAG
jgi:hypothetical protein